MEKKGFSKEFSSVVTATSAMITPLILPELKWYYGSIANVSIVFVADYVGAMLCVALMILYILCLKRGYKPLHDERIK